MLTKTRTLAFVIALAGISPFFTAANVRAQDAKHGRHCNQDHCVCKGVDACNSLAVDCANKGGKYDGTAINPEQGPPYGKCTYPTSATRSRSLSN